MKRAGSKCSGTVCVKISSLIFVQLDSLIFIPASYPIWHEMIISYLVHQAAMVVLVSEDVDEKQGAMFANAVIFLLEGR